MKTVGSLCVLLLVIAAVYCTSDEEKLIDDLHKKANIHVPPRLNTTTEAKVVVHFGLSLLNIGYVERTRKEEIEFNYWGRYSWIDYRLRWDPAAYNNINTTRFPSHWLWKPDIALYNGLHDDGMFVLQDSDKKPKPFAVVYNTGKVLYIPPISSRVRCPHSRLSGNTLSCNLKFGSWVYDGNMIDFDLYNGKSTVDLADFNDAKWKVTNSSITHVNKHYACCVEPYPYMEVNITIQAKPRKPRLQVRTTPISL